MWKPVQRVNLEATWPTESGRICQQAGWATANIPRIKPQ